MPGMNVRGDQHLNFTPEEAAAWLGRVPVRHHAPPAHDNDDGIAGMIGVVALVVVLVIIGVAIYGSPQRQLASNAAGTSVQPGVAVTQETATADTRRPEAIAENVSLPTATSEDSPSPDSSSEDSSAPVANIPAGWFYGRLQGELPLRNTQGRSLGALPDGTIFFGTTAASAVQVIVAADGSYWGFGELKPPENVPSPPIPITPAFEKAARLIRQIEASGIVEAVRPYIPQRDESEEEYLPAGWTIRCLIEDQPLTYGVYGVEIGTVRKGTCLLHEIADVQGWRTLISPDGSYRGYARIPLWYTVPPRTPMRSEYAGAVALVHRLEHGSGSQGLDEMREAFAKNAPTPLPDGGGEQ